ncbi:MAG: GxxExxY protein [Patescibacteria group bacterium]|nr:GxxExxY protein [Patescibacteria group bacterium]
MPCLKTPLSELTSASKTTLNRLEKLKIQTAEDLLYHFPFRYDDYSKILTIAELKTKKSGTIKGKISLIANHRSPRKKMVITEAIISDKTDSIKVVWFNQPFLTKILRSGLEIYLAGKIDVDDYYGMQFLYPSYEIVNSKDPIHTGRLVPIYPATVNLSQKQIRYLIRQTIPLTQDIEDWLPREIRSKYNLTSTTFALEQIHFPQNREWLERAAHRLKFDELFLIQTRNQLVRQKIKSLVAPKIEFKLEETKKFVDNLPFKLTDAQRKSSWEIINNLETSAPMNRLLEGDVGSGKTIVGVLAILNVLLNGYQVAYMAPTEILAEQHFKNITELLKDYPFKIGLLTRENIKTNKDEKNKKVKIYEEISSGKIKLIIGTHSLIQEKVKFKNLAMTIIDEQHRFGVAQRAAFLAKSNPDMTQTNTDETRTDTDTSTQTNADITRTDTDKKNNNLLYENLTYQIRGIMFKIKKELGLGHKENIYQKAIEKEFKKNNIKFEKEKIINIQYDNEKIGTYRPDFIVDDKIIVEIKALPSIGKFETEQIWHYLKSSDYHLALLVNFGKDDIQIKRTIHGYMKQTDTDEALTDTDNKKNHMESPRKSASSQCKSALMPHFLSMTATPIPRSVALTLYGDLDLSIIDEMPPGRKKVLTSIVKPDETEKIYKFIREEIKNGRQIFVICPLIDQSDQLGVKSVKEEYKKLSEKIFPDLTLGFLHGRMKAKEKEEIMKKFDQNKINILISTTVIEVGIDIPNASVMIVEGAERFGLAQLYQLRGRIGRAEHQSHCFLFLENEGEKAKQRLKALITAQNGFELAEMDLEMRGPGEVFGTSQAGFFTDLKIARLSDVVILKEAQEAADKVFNKDNSLKTYPLLQNKISQFAQTAHLE